MSRIGLSVFLLEFDKWKIRKQFLQALSVVISCLVLCIQVIQVCIGNGHGQGVNAVLKAKARQRVAAVLGILPQRLDTLVVPHGHGTLKAFLVIGNQNAALTCGKHLGALHGEASYVSERANLFALVGSTVCVGAVLNHLYTVLVGNSHDGIHIAGVAPNVYHDNRLGFWGDLCLNALSGHLVGFLVYIGKLGDRTNGNDRTGRCPEGKGRHDHLVSRLNANSKQTGHNRSGTVANAQTVLDTNVCGKALFKGFYNGGGRSL